jgi:hypothetical protein
LTSLAKPDSIRVAGTTDNHPARINDLTIDLVPNKFSSLDALLDEAESDEEDEKLDSLKQKNVVHSAQEELSNNSLLQLRLPLRLKSFLIPPL